MSLILLLDVIVLTGDAAGFTPPWPPNNGKGPIRFERWYADALSGNYYPESQLARDYMGRLRYIGDLETREDLDQTREGWSPPTETEDPEP